MLCANCGVEAIIGATRTEVVGDESPSTQTEVYEVLSYRCRNPQCPQSGQEIGTERIKIYPAKGGERHE